MSTPKGNKTFKVDPNQALQDNIDTSADISLNITSPKYEASFKLKCNGKTAYVSWNTAKKMPLYPQTGPLMGLMGKTESGLSLSNNIKSSDFGVSVVKEQ